MTSRNQSGQRFSLVFVENIRQSRIQRAKAKRRFLNKRPAAIEALMAINKSDSEIQNDLQTAFIKIAHGPSQH